MTDTVFSMDGDVADLGAVCDVAEAAQALVVVDEAHGSGVLGEQGRGAAEAQGVEERVALSVGTLSKAFGSVGGFVAGPRAAVETIVNAGRSFIYTTALPAACQRGEPGGAADHRERGREAAARTRGGVGPACEAGVGGHGLRLWGIGDADYPGDDGGCGDGGGGGGEVAGARDLGAGDSAADGGAGAAADLADVGAYGRAGGTVGGGDARLAELRRRGGRRIGQSVITAGGLRAAAH